MKGHVTDIDNDEGLVFVKFDNGKQHQINLNEIDSGHWNHNYVTTAHAAQGVTADRVIYHGESFRRNLSSQQAFYVAISRAKHGAIVVTDNRIELEKQINEHSGEKQYASHCSEIELTL